MKKVWLWLSWLIFAPAYFFISRRQGVKTWKRWLLTVLSPSWYWIVILIFVCTLLIADLFLYKSLDFDDVKFNTPELVEKELDIKNMPAFHYVGNSAKAEFNYDYWDCVVEFKFEDSLSVRSKKNIIRQVARKDKLYWKYKDVGSNIVAEFYNIKYSDSDTIRYNIIITNERIYVAYTNRINYPTNEFFAPSEYHLIGVTNGYVGPDSSHSWTIQLKEPYTHYLNRFARWGCEETSDEISFTKRTYMNDCLQSDEYVIFYKKRNVAIVRYIGF